MRWGNFQVAFLYFAWNSNGALILPSRTLPFYDLLLGIYQESQRPEICWSLQSYHFVYYLSHWTCHRRLVVERTTRYSREKNRNIEKIFSCYSVIQVDNMIKIVVISLDIFFVNKSQFQMDFVCETLTFLLEIRTIFIQMLT